MMPPHVRPGTGSSLVEPDAFLGLVRGAALFKRTLIARPDLRVTHHRVGPGDYGVDGLASHGIAVQVGGVNRYMAEMDGKRYDGWTPDGHVWVKPAGLPIRWEWPAPAEVVNLWIPPAVWAERLAEATDGGARGAELVPHFPMSDPLVHRIGAALSRAQPQLSPLEALLVDGLFSALIAHLALHHSDAGVPAPAWRGGLAPARLRRVVEHVDAHLDQDLRLADLAALARLSPGHFREAFRRSTGRSPHRFLAERRVERARALLADRRLSIAEVAAAVGYSSQSHLTSRFRAVTGTTPDAFRRAL